MRWPFVSRSRYDAAHAEANRLRAERDAALKDADTWYHAATRTSELYVDTSLVNECLTHDLTAAKERLAEYGVRRTVSDVLEEHDVNRKALAEAIHAGLHLNWEQLIDTARRTYEAATEWRADYEAQRKRADQLQARLDDACGLDDPGVQAGVNWQARRVDKPKPQVTS